MSGPVAIVTDSTATIPEAFLEPYPIRIASQLLIWGEETLRDGVDIQPDQFYRRLESSSVMPTTSQASPAALKEIFNELANQGYDILAILISSKLSGTIASAEQAKALLPEARIEIVDSLSAAMAMGFQVLAAAKLAVEGASLEECKALAEKAKDHAGVVLAVDTLEYLHRGGRIGGGTRFLGTALNIKPILELRDGRIEALERVRTRKKSLKRLIELVEERTAGQKPLRISALHANAAGEAQELLERATEELSATESIFSEVSPAIGVHVGPGTIGLAFMAGI